MIETMIRWLLEVEQAAQDTYRQAAENYKDVPPLRHFLLALAEDEQEHIRLLNEAAAGFCHGSYPDLPVLLDRELIDQAKAPLDQLQQALQRGRLSLEQLFEGIVRVEYGEWNDIFLYITSSLSQQSETRPILAEIQNHERRIEHFFGAFPEASMAREAVAGLAKAWPRNFLVVESDKPLQGLYRGLLEREGSVVTVGSGRAALPHLTSAYFDVIISEVDRPEEGGVTFLQQALEHDSRTAERVLICTADISAELDQLVQRHQLRRLQKPLHLKELLRTIDQMMLPSDSRPTSGPVH